MLHNGSVGLYTLLLIALKVHRGETLGASAYAKCFMGLLSLFVSGRLSLRQFSGY